MSDQAEVQKAIKEAMQTERDAMDFYKYGAEKMTTDKARRAFEILAAEEKQHAHMFYSIYTGTDVPDFEAFMSAAPNTSSSWWKALQQADTDSFDERKAMELAIEQEEKLEKALRAKAETIEDDAIKQVYLANARSTHHHFELCMEEYKALQGAS